MSVRNLGELGPSLKKIVNRLAMNEELGKLLYYNDIDPLSKDIVNKLDLLKDYILLTPVVANNEDTSSKIVVRIDNGEHNEDNDEYSDFNFTIEVFVPNIQWIIKDDNLRPFSIIGQIQKSLNRKTINGLGKIQGGDFALAFYTEKMSCYNIKYWITAYD